MIGPRTREQVIWSLESERRELLSQYRRQVHTCRSDGIQRRMDQIDRQIAEFKSAGETRKR